MVLDNKIRHQNEYSHAFTAKCNSDAKSRTVAASALNQSERHLYAVEK